MFNNLKSGALKGLAGGWGGGVSATFVLEFEGWREKRREGQEEGEWGEGAKGEGEEGDERK